MSWTFIYCLLSRYFDTHLRIIKLKTLIVCLLIYTWLNVLSNIAGIQNIITYIDQYLNSFRIKGCINSSHTQLTYYTRVKIDIVLQVRFNLIFFC